MADRSAEPLGEPRLRPVRRAEPSDTAPSKWAEFAAILDRHRGERLLILLTGYPDPDSIASGLALQHLAREHGIESRLLCFHEVSHQENQALVTKLELDLWLFDSRSDLEPYTLYAFVDSPRTDTPIPLDDPSQHPCFENVAPGARAAAAPDPRSRAAQ